jgi:hypothetical protein
LDQFGAGFYAVGVARMVFKKEVVNNEPQIRLAGTMIGQSKAFCPRNWCRSWVRSQLQQQLFNELIQMVNLLEFAPRVLIELPVPRENMQLLE